MNEESIEAADRPVRKASVRLAVVEMDWGWSLFLNGEGIGRFGDRARAMRCAMDVARDTRRDGCDVEVLSHDRFGEIYSAERQAPLQRDLSEGAAA